jgi:hypothetical protein
MMETRFGVDIHVYFKLLRKAFSQFYEQATGYLSAIRVISYEDDFEG